jgi:hypothetical protein
MPYNVNNITSPSNCQDTRTNFEIVQDLLRYIWRLGITGSAFRVLLYQVDQEFCYIRDGKTKDGDKVCHRTRCRHIGITYSTDSLAIKELELLNVISVERKHRIANRYHINRDTSTWILQNIPEDSDTDDTSDTTDTISSLTDNTTEPKEWVNIDYQFHEFHLIQLQKRYSDEEIENEKVWLNNNRVPQEQAFIVLFNKRNGRHPTK